MARYLNLKNSDGVDEKFEVEAYLGELEELREYKSGRWKSISKDLDDRVKKLEEENSIYRKRYKEEKIKAS